MTSRVAVLGTGIMGSGMARSLLRAGFDVVVWNRSAEKTGPLAEAGARVAETPGEAVADAGTVLTMLFDADSVAGVVGGCSGAFAPDAVWLQCTTVGVDGARQLAELASRHGLRTLDAPVLGTREPAEKGELTMLVSGPAELRPAVDPVLAAVGGRTHWAGETYGAASRLKLAASAWGATAVSGVAQSLALARRLGLEPRQFLDAVAGSAVDAPAVRLKGAAMIEEDWTPSLGIGNLLKDLDLVKAAMEGSHTDSALLDAVRGRFAAAAGHGYGSADTAAVVTAY